MLRRSLGIMKHGQYSLFVDVSNNSQMTHEVFNILTTKLSLEDYRKVEEWLRHVRNKVETGNSWETKAKRLW